MTVFQTDNQSQIMREGTRKSAPMDHEQSQNRRRSNLVALSPTQSSKSTKEIRTLDSSVRGKVEREANLQVILRCRPLNGDGIEAEIPTAILCDEERGEISLFHQTKNRQKTLSFDKVFGPKTQQKDVYEAVSSLVNDVLEGYNCTIFAYGPTGSGKTYTMEGQKITKDGGLHEDAGVIPRAVQQIYHVLDAKNAEYSLKVSYIEIYNEEIMDLLSSDDSLGLSSSELKIPMILMEDSGGATFLRGLKQELVNNAANTLNVFERGSAKRRTAETLLSKQSSRSHSVFSMTVQIKGCTPEGQDLIKIGKLNLVDLAGAENIIQSGAKELRAREAGEINKSLLTLGRVITALVEHSEHVPYRDSKLTRLLRDSLGGPAKTCIIATISPSSYCLDETLNTLEYAYRAKSIKNKPRVNFQILRSELVKDLYAEITQLRKELDALKEKNHVDMSQDSQSNKEIQINAKNIDDMKLYSDLKEKQLLELQELYNKQQHLIAELKEELNTKKKELKRSENSFLLLKDEVDEAKAKIKERDDLISDLRNSEKALLEQALKMQKELESAAFDISCLSAKADFQDKVIERRKSVALKLRSNLTSRLEVLHKTVADTAEQHEQQLKAMNERMLSFTSKRKEAIEELVVQLRKIQGIYSCHIRYLSELAGDCDKNFQSLVDNLYQEISSGFSSCEDIFKERFSEGICMIDEIKNSISRQEDMHTAFILQHRESNSQTLELTRTTCGVLLKFLGSIKDHTFSICQAVEDSKEFTRQELYELEKKFEDFAADEKSWVMEKMAVLLEDSDNRKRNMVQKAVSCFLESTSSRACKIGEEMSLMKDNTSEAENEWTNYAQQMETAFTENTSILENKTNNVEECCRYGLEKVKEAGRFVENISESILDLQQRNVGTLTSILENGVEVNQTTNIKLSYLLSCAAEEVNSEYGDPIYTTNNLSKSDEDLHKDISSFISVSSRDSKEMTNTHQQETLEIKETARKSLLNEYEEDEKWSLRLDC